jgi:hypothetical protein
MGMPTNRREPIAAVGLRSERPARQIELRYFAAGCGLKIVIVEGEEAIARLVVVLHHDFVRDNSMRRSRVAAADCPIMALSDAQLLCIPRRITYLADVFSGPLKPLNFAVQSGTRRGNVVGRYRYDYLRHFKGLASPN